LEYRLQAGKKAHPDLAYLHDPHTPPKRACAAELGQPNSRCLAPEDLPKAARPPPAASPKRRFRGVVGRTFPSRVPALTSARLLPREVRFMGRTHFSDDPSAAVSENSYAGGAGLLPVLLRWCPAPFFPDTKDRHPRPSAVVLATVPWDKRNLPTFSLNRLFSPCFSLCSARRLSIESPRCTERLGACLDPASTQKPDEPENSRTVRRSDGARLLWSDNCELMTDSRLPAFSAPYLRRDKFGPIA
jgi:hypothetical protein